MLHTLALEQMIPFPPCPFLFFFPSLMLYERKMKIIALHYYLVLFTFVLLRLHLVREHMRDLSRARRTLDLFSPYAGWRVSSSRALL